MLYLYGDSQIVMVLALWVALMVVGVLVIGFIQELISKDSKAQKKSATSAKVNTQKQIGKVA